MNFYNQPCSSKTHSYSGIVADAQNNELMNAFPPSTNVNARDGELLPGQNVYNHQLKTETDRGRSNDIDTYKLNEMQENFKTMNEMVIKLTTDLEAQKVRMELENQKRSDDLKHYMEEKQKIKNEYEEKVKELNEKIEILQKGNNKNSDEDKANLTKLIEKQQTEINTLKQSLEITASRCNTPNKDNFNENVKVQIEKLKQDLKLAEKTNEAKLKKLKNDLQREYEQKLITEKEKHSEELNNLKQTNLTRNKTEKESAIIKPKRIISKPLVSTKEEQKYENLKPIKKTKFDLDEEYDSHSETETSKWYEDSNPQKSEEETSDETGTYENTTEIKRDQNRSKTNYFNRRESNENSYAKKARMYTNYDETSSENEESKESEENLNEDSMTRHVALVWKEYVAIGGSTSNISGASVHKYWNHHQCRNAPSRQGYQP